MTTPRRRRARPLRRSRSPPGVLAEFLGVTPTAAMHDSQAAGAGSAHPLLPHLRAFVAAGGDKSHAAQTLFVQRRTLYYRLARISEILGHNIEEPDLLQNLTFAIRALDLLEAPSS